MPKGKSRIILEDWGSSSTTKAFRVNRTFNTVEPRPGDWLTLGEVQAIIDFGRHDVYIERHKTKGE